MKILKIFIFLILIFFSNLSFAEEKTEIDETQIINQEIDQLKNNLIEKNQEKFIENVVVVLNKIKFNKEKLTIINDSLTKLSKKIYQYDYPKLDILKLKIKYIEVNIKKELTKFKTLKIDQEDNIHIKTPETVKSIYYTSYSAWNDKKLKNLIYLAKNKEINSVTIDIKEVDWYTAFDFWDFYFDKIKPETNNRINDVKKLIEDLHKENIYVIWRIVVFKDNLLSSKRKDLAIKKLDKKTVWEDYSWNNYLDASSKEVWDYTVNLASASYQLWFDEINFDYVRFPSDWNISKTYYNFSNEILNQYPTYWKIVVLDKFSNYLTSKLREKHKDIKLSADVFWLVTNWDMLWIWQKLESYLLYFDYVCPMTYPSHYWVNYLWFSVPDNHPYEILLDAMKHASIKIDDLNIEIQNAKDEQRKIKLLSNYETDLQIETYSQIDKNKIRPRLQWFNCTWCKWYTTYNREKFRKQISALNDSWYYSWFVWNSSSNYYFDWYNK